MPCAACTDGGNRPVSLTLRCRLGGSWHASLALTAEKNEQEMGPDARGAVDAVIKNRDSTCRQASRQCVQPREGNMGWHGVDGGGGLCEMRWDAWYCGGEEEWTKSGSRKPAGGHR
jgi:hypothetical protein